MSNKHKKLPTKATAPAMDIKLFVYTNDLNEPGTVEILKLFYKGSFENTIGIARCKNAITGKIESILVGISPQEGGFYPLAKVLDPQEAANLLPPNGEGGYFEPTKAETSGEAN